MVREAAPEEDATDAEIDADLAAAGIDMEPAYERLRNMIAKYKEQRDGEEAARLEGVRRADEEAG
jgi:hypothetical protein